MVVVDTDSTGATCLRLRRLAVMSLVFLVVVVVSGIDAAVANW